MAAEDELYYTQSQLLDDIFQDYDKTFHPTAMIGSPVNVTLGIAVTQIVRVVSKKLSHITHPQFIVRTKALNPLFN